MDYTEFDKLVRGKNINFLIGAGASVPMYPTLTLGEGLPSFEDIASHTKISKRARNILYIYFFLKWIEPMGVTGRQFRENHSKDAVFINYKKLIKAIYDFLRCESNERPKRINIFTTNYDLLFERAFDDFLLDNPLVYFNDGSRGVFTKYVSNKNFYLNITHSGYNDNYKREVPTVNLFKLHGSLSWELENNRIVVKENNECINEVRKKIEELGINLNQIERIVLDSSNENVDVFVDSFNEAVESQSFDSDLLDEFYDMYSKIPIINPNKYKFFETVSEQHYYQLIRSFSYELERKQTVLIVFGFSFADEHIRDIFERSLLNPELQVIMISYDFISQKKLKEMFEGYNNIKFLPEKFDVISGDLKYLLSLLGEFDE